MSWRSEHSVSHWRKRLSIIIKQVIRPSAQTLARTSRHPPPALKHHSSATDASWNIHVESVLFMLSIYTFKDTGRINCRDFFFLFQEAKGCLKAGSKQRNEEIRDYFVCPVIQIDSIWYLGGGGGRRPNRSTNAAAFEKAVFICLFKDLLTGLCVWVNKYYEWPLARMPIWTPVNAAFAVNFPPVFDITDDTVRTVRSETGLKNGDTDKNDHKRVWFF